MDLLIPGLLGVALAAGVSALVLASARGRAWGVPLGLGCGFALGHAAVRGWLMAPEWPTGPPLDAVDWAPWLALVAAGLGAIDAARPVGKAWRWSGRALLTAAAIALVLGPLMSGAWEAEPRHGLDRLIGLGLALLAAWGATAVLVVRRGGGAALPLLGWCAGSGGVLAAAHSLALGASAVTLAAALGPVAILAIWRPERAGGRGWLAVVVVALAALTLGGLFYADLPTTSAVLLALAPLALAIDRLGPVRRRPTWAIVLLRVAAVLVPVVAALAIALVTSAGGEGEW